MAIRALLFDNFGVLMDPIFDSFQSALPERAFQMIQRANSQSDCGEITHEERATKVINILNNNGLDGESEISRAYSNSHRNDQLFDFIGGARQTYKTAILSNASANIHDIYDASDLAKYFDEVIWSYEVGMTKPNPAIYYLAAGRLETDPSECVFIDDKESNVIAARDCGMVGIIYQGFDDFKRQLLELTANA